MQTTRNNRRAFLCRLLLVLLLAIGAELILSNFYAVYNAVCYQDHVYSRADMTTSDNQENIFDGERFLVDSDHCSLSFSSLPSAVHSVSFRVLSADGETYGSLPYAQLYGSDENLSQQTVTYATQALNVGRKTPAENRIRLSTHGTPSLLELYFDSEEELIVCDVRFNEPEGFSFHPLRFGALLILGAFLFIAKTFGLSRRRLDFFSREGRVILATLLLFALLLSLAVGFFFMGKRPFSVISYPLLTAEENYSPYVQQFDAFQKGQLSLDVAVSEELAALDNPYDPDQREQVDYLWDRAYFEGNYYSYFGIAPLLVLYYPFYLLGAVLPGDGIVLTVFSALAGIFTVLCLWELGKLTKKKLSVSHFVLGSLACLFASMIWLMQRGVDRFYYVASLSAVAFGAITLYCLLKGLFCPHTKKRRLLLAAAGLAYSLLLLSRINTALLYTLLLLCLLAVYLKKNMKRPMSVLGDLICPVLTVLSTVAFLLIFNALRFHDPLEFGTRYQLTVSNTAYNRPGIENLLPSLYHYFLEPLTLSTRFPFLGFSSLLLPNYGHYVYLAATNAGLLCMPLNWSLLAFGALWKKRTLPKEYRRICLAVLLSLPLLGWLSYSLGGSILRYVADLAPVCALLSTMILWEICDGASTEAPCHAERCALSGCKALFLLTVVIGTFLLFNRTSVDLAPYSLEIFGTLQDLFTL